MLNRSVKTLNSQTWLAPSILSSAWENAESKRAAAMEQQDGDPALNACH